MVMMGGGRLWIRGSPVLPSSRPLLVVGGAQKSASTSLAQWMGQHSSVVMGKKECLDFEGARAATRAGALARRSEELSREGKILGIKRPEVFHNPHLLLRVVSAFPRCQIVVILRDPVARTLSALAHYRKLGVIPRSWSLDDVLREWRRSQDATPAGQIVQYSLYAENLARLLTIASDPCVVYQDDLLANPEGFARSAFGRLGLAPEELGHVPRANIGSSRQELPSRLAATIGKVAYRWDPLERIILRRSLVCRCAAKLLLHVGRAAPGRTDSSLDRLDIVSRAELWKIFAPDIAEVEALLGRAPPGSWSTGPYRATP
jgi:hypothetical protein